MTDLDPTLDARYLEIFPAFLRGLGDDATALAAIVAGGAPESVRRQAIAGINYIFKSLDLIPDGIDDLGFLDDAFVLRVAASLAVANEEGPEGAANEALTRLAHDATQIRAFLGDEIYGRLEAYVRSLGNGSARGRTVDDILGSDETRDAFVHEVQAWAKNYKVPSFTRDVKTLIKLKAFLGARLA